MTDHAGMPLSEKHERLLAQLESEYRSEHHYASIADHPAMKDRVDRDVEGAIEPIRDELAALRARVEVAEKDSQRMYALARMAESEFGEFKRTTYRGWIFTPDAARQCIDEFFPALAVPTEPAPTVSR